MREHRERVPKYHRKEIKVWNRKGSKKKQVVFGVGRRGGVLEMSDLSFYLVAG